MENDFERGYRQALRDVRNRVEEFPEEWEEPSGQVGTYYRANLVMETLLDLALSIAATPPSKGREELKRKKGEWVTCTASLWNPNDS